MTVSGDERVPVGPELSLEVKSTAAKNLETNVYRLFIESQELKK
jgi:hypothetical protein